MRQVAATGWVEVGDRCFARSYAPYNVTVGVVIGADGLALIDTRTCPREAREVLADLAELAHPARTPIRAVINTHWHFDHCFGNAAFGSPGPDTGLDAGPPILGHESVPRRLADSADAVRREVAAQSPELAADLAELTVVPPTVTFAAVASISLGDRVVELSHPGRGHTDGDIVAAVPDADVVFAGDLVEQAGPPAYGDDSFPLEWPASMDVVSGLLTDATTIVPGHGTAVDRAFVLDQRAGLTAVAETITGLWSSGVGEADALAAGADHWPFPADALALAVARAYAVLRDRPPQPRSLPLVT